MFKVLLIVLLGVAAAMAMGTSLLPAPLEAGFRDSGFRENYLRDSSFQAGGYGGLLGYGPFFGHPGLSNRYLSAYDREAYNREGFNRLGYNRFLGYPSLGFSSYGYLF